MKIRRDFPTRNWKFPKGCLLTLGHHTYLKTKNSQNREGTTKHTSSDPSRGTFTRLAWPYLVLGKEGLLTRAAEAPKANN